jgi:hypothetical protein
LAVGYGCHGAPIPSCLRRFSAFRPDCYPLQAGLDGRVQCSLGETWRNYSAGSLLLN